MLNPFGFGAADFVELYIALALALLAMLWHPRIESLARRLAEKTLLCAILLAILPVALRLFLLPHHPVPQPDIYDEFGHLFVADTLRHWRLSNPAHPLHQFFETFFILQQPTYSSIYPIGQGLMLAIGRALFGLPWAGVVLSTAAFCALCFWMLRGWVSPLWALAGGLLAVFEFGPLSPWMNTYWGGSLGAAAGCLVFGALPRLIRNPRRRDALALGVGLALNLLLRPFESIALFFSVGLFFVPVLRRPKILLVRSAPIVAAAVALALGITLLQNKSVTGSWTTLPYQLSQYQYGVPAALTFQANPIPHATLTPQQELEYKVQLSFRSSAPETPGTYLERLIYRIGFYRVFFLPPLYLAVLAFILSIFIVSAQRWRFAWAGITLIAFALITNFFPAFQFHYVAAVTCLFVLVSVWGLQQIARLRPEAARIILFLCVAHFVFWYGIHVFDDESFSVAMRRWETSEAINHRNPARRIAVNEQLARIRGQLLVFVRYWPQHIFQDEWVYNEADIDHARIVWARDLGNEENRKLTKYYPGRSVWLLEPDARPPSLQPYREEPGPAAPAMPEETKPLYPKLKLEDVPH